MSPLQLYTCVGCGNRDASGLFAFPQDPLLRKVWLEKCGINPSINLARRALLCKRHFMKEDIFFSDKRLSLKKNAVPSVRVDPAPDKTKRQACRYEMGCYVCGQTNADSFHRVPKDPEIRKKWLTNVGVEFYAFNPMPTSDIRLCSSHFSEKDFCGHPHSLRSRLCQGAEPIVQPQNGRNTQTGTSTKYPVKINNNGDGDLSDPDVTFVSSSSSNTECTITLTDDAEEHMKSKTSKVNPQNFKPISSREKNILKKKVSNQSTISSKEENAPIATIDLTEDVGESSIAESALLAKKRKHVRNLILKKKKLKNQLAQHRALLDVLLKENDLVTKKGRKVIKEFLRTFLNPAE